MQWAGLQELALAKINTAASFTASLPCFPWAALDACDRMTCPVHSKELGTSQLSLSIISRWEVYSQLVWMENSPGGPAAEPSLICSISSHLAAPGLEMESSCRAGQLQREALACAKGKAAGIPPSKAWCRDIPRPWFCPHSPPRCRIKHEPLMLVFFCCHRSGVGCSRGSLFTHPCPGGVWAV